MVRFNFSIPQCPPERSYQVDTHGLTSSSPLYFAHGDLPFSHPHYLRERNRDYMQNNVENFHLQGPQYYVGVSPSFEESSSGRALYEAATTFEQPTTTAGLDPEPLGELCWCTIKYYPC